MRRLAIVMLAAWLAGVMTLGRAFSSIGVAPIFLGDALAVCGVMLLLPLWWPRLFTPGLRWYTFSAAALLILNVHAVLVGVERGYQSALKSGVMGVYPLVGLAIAGVVSVDPSRARHLRFLVLLPTLGYAYAYVRGLEPIPAAHALYLAIALAFSGTMTGNWRRAGVLTNLVGIGLLFATIPKRGPALAILVAAAVTVLLGSRVRGRERRLIIDTRLVIGVTLGGAALILFVIVLSLAGIDAGSLPVVGDIIERVVSTNVAGSEAANNVAIREVFWKYAIHTTMSENPLLGVGAGHPLEVTFASRDISGNDTGVHNSFVGYAFYMGFPAALIVFSLFLGATRAAWLASKDPLMSPAILGSIFAVVVICLTNVALETPYIAGPSWAIVGAAYGVRLFQRQRAADEQAHIATKDLASVHR